MNRRATALSIAALALFGLTACTAPSGGGTLPDSSPGASVGSDASGDEGQSVADACVLVQDTITSATDEFDKATEGDPAAVVEAMRSAADELATLSEQITNDEVAAVLPGVRDMYLQTAEIMQAVTEGDLTKLEELGELGDSMQQTMQAYERLCLTP